MDQTAYLGAAKQATIGTQTLIYGLLEPLAPLRSTLQSSVLTVIGIGGLTIIATLAGVAFIATRLLSPIRQLREGAVRIGSGDLGQRIAVTTGDELETLADQFNDMAAKLQESYADLEKKIDLRTRELGQSVAELRALGEVSQTVNSTLDLQTVLSTIVFKAVQLSGTEAGAIYGFDAPSREFRLRATYGMSEAMIAALTKHSNSERAQLLKRRGKAPLYRFRTSAKGRYHRSTRSLCRQAIGRFLRSRCFVQTVSSAPWSCAERSPESFPSTRWIFCRPSPRSRWWRSKMHTYFPSSPLRATLPTKPTGPNRAFSLTCRMSCAPR